ncbi:MAG: FAD:protein FMN transferase [Thalassolituus maritimus]|nr:MAG: FAD:protein FMN transferase [Thalassolituus maritimus]
MLLAIRRKSNSPSWWKLQSLCILRAIMKKAFVSMNKNLQTVFVLLLSVVFMASCSEPQPELRRISGFTMGSQYHISWFGGEATPTEVHEQVEDRLAHLISVFSTYEKNSELSRLNSNSETLAGKPVQVSPELMSVLQDASYINRYSMGRLDVTVGPLVNLWGFGPEEREGVPSQAEVDQLLEMTGMNKLALDKEKNEILMDVPLYIDLSAVAKGWAVDDIGLLLEAMEISDYLVEIGGEVRIRGAKPSGDWRIAIERPVMEVGHSAQRIIAPGNHAVATSGDYRNYFEENGQRYSHTIDPLTGYPIRHALASVSVILPTCSLADAWATALNVAGPEAAMALAEANDLPAYFIIRDGDGFKEASSSAFERMFGSAGH